MHPRTRLVYFYFLRVNFLVKTSMSGRRDKCGYHGNATAADPNMAVFVHPPQVTYLHTKNEGGLKFFIPYFRLHFPGELLLMINAGFSDGLPIGMVVVGRQEWRRHCYVRDVAFTYEKVRLWWDIALLFVFHFLAWKLPTSFRSSMNYLLLVENQG